MVFLIKSWKRISLSLVFISLVSLLFTLGHFIFFITQHNIVWEEWIIPKGDAVDYMGAAKNVVESGCYCYPTSIPVPSNTYKGEFDKDLLYAFRTPGYVPIYFFANLISKKSPIFVIILLEIFFFSLTKALLLLYINYKTKSPVALLGGFLILNLSPFAHHLTGRLLTEIFAISFLVFGLFTFPTKNLSQNPVRLFFSSVFFLEAVLLRPFLLPLFALPYFKIMFRNFSVRTFMVFSLPLIAFFSFWTVRNYVLTDRFILLSSTFRIFDASNKSFYEQRRLSKFTGLTGHWYEKGNEISWFKSESDTRKPDDIYPKVLFHQPLVCENLLLAKILYLKSLNTSINQTDRLSAELESARILKNIVDGFIRDKPFYALVISGFHTFYEMIDFPIFKPLTDIRYPLNIIPVFLEVIVNDFLLIFGFFGVLLYRPNSDFRLVFAYSVIVFISFFFPFILKGVEFREFFIPYILLSVPAILIAHQLFTRRKWLLLAVLTLPTLYWSKTGVIHAVNW